jgi:cytochrome c oxidase cbb3-type subunit 3
MNLKFSDMRKVSNNILAYQRLLILIVCFFSFSGLEAQPINPVINSGPSKVISNPLFIILLVTALVLMGIIMSLSSTIKNIAEAGKEKIQKKNTGGINPLIWLIFILPTQIFAQVAADGPVTDKYIPPMQIGGLDSWIFVILLVLIVVELIIIFGLIRSVQQLLIGFGFQKDPQLEEVKPWINWKWLDRKLTDAIPIELEATVMTDHEYDGIRELDNNLPPWWKYGFYFTIVFGIVYIYNYHIARSSPLQLQEYTAELVEADSLKKEQLKNAAASIDESNVTALLDATSLGSAKEIYSGNCANCHGQNGEGGVGPNMTDAYWIHGGGIQNIFKTIKYGVPAKGMIAWQAQLNPEAIQKVASYILTLQGTNPANGKAAQGTIWTEVAMPDSLYADIKKKTQDTLSSN